MRKFNEYVNIVMESVKTYSLPTIQVLYDFVKNMKHEGDKNEKAKEYASKIFSR